MSPTKPRATGSTLRLSSAATARCCAHLRGSSALRGTMDVSIEMDGAKGWEDNNRQLSRSLFCRKQRDGERFNEIEFRLKEVTWKASRKPQARPQRSLVPVIL